MKAARRKTCKSRSAGVQKEAAATLWTEDLRTDGALPGDRKWPCSGRSNGKKSFFTAVSCVQQNPLESTSRVSPPRLQRRAEPRWVARASPGVLSTFPRKKESRCFSQGHQAQPPAAPRQRLPRAAILPSGACARLRAPGPWNDRAPRAHGTPARVCHGLGSGESSTSTWGWGHLVGTGRLDFQDIKIGLIERGVGYD